MNNNEAIESRTVSASRYFEVVAMREMQYLQTIENLKQEIELLRRELTKKES